MRGSRALDLARSFEKEHGSTRDEPNGQCRVTLLSPLDVCTSLQSVPMSNRLFGGIDSRVHEMLIWLIKQLTRVVVGSPS